MSTATISRTNASYADTIHTYRFPKPNDTSDQVRQRRRQQRRHSTHSSTTGSSEAENIQDLLDSFLAELSRRLESLESYGAVTLDGGMARAYAALQSVRDACSYESDTFIGAGRRRASVFVEALERRYSGALPSTETMEGKVQDSIQILSKSLTDLETRAYARRNSVLATASEYMGQGHRRISSGIHIARQSGHSVGATLRRASIIAKDHVKLKVERAIESAKKHGLIGFEDLPEPWRVNPHITGGYRFNTTTLDCFYSLAGMSNEFVNIWSHLIGLFLVIGTALFIYPETSTFSSSSTADVVVALMFFAAAAKCLICSTVFHTMCSISSQTLLERFACVDYTGISMLVATTIITTEWSAFYCEPISRWSYIAMTLIFGTIGTILPWHPVFNRSDLAWLRVVFFCSLALTGFIPPIQVIWTRGVHWAIYFYTPIAKSLSIYFVGAILYACKVPERWFPGRFNYFGMSHNIWHFAVLAGIYYHYLAMHWFFNRAFDRVQAGGCDA